MLRKSFFLTAAAALLASALPVSAWSWSDPHSNGGFGPGPFPPSYYGYPLDDFTAGYYCGSRYREYYGYGRGFGVANMPPNPTPARIEPYGYLYPARTHNMVHDEPWITPAPVAQLNVHVPADAQVWLEGNPTRQTGPNRLYVSPPLQAGHQYSYEIRARWTENGRAREETRHLTVRAGDRLDVAFPGMTAAPTVPAPRPLTVDTER